MIERILELANKLGPEGKKRLLEFHDDGMQWDDIAFKLLSEIEQHKARITSLETEIEDYWKDQAGVDI